MDKKWYQKNTPVTITIMILAIIFFVVCIYIAFFSPWGFDAQDAAVNASAATEVISDSGGVKITKAQFEAVETGMTEDEMFEILGGKGEIISDSDIGYGEYEIKTVMYEYEGTGVVGANANFTVQNGKVVSKAQAGLK